MKIYKYFICSDNNNGTKLILNLIIMEIIIGNKTLKIRGKDYSKIEYRDTLKKGVVYREIYENGVFRNHTVFCKDSINNSKLSYFVSLFDNRFEKLIKSYNDFDNFIENLDTNMKLVSNFTDSLLWHYSTKEAKNLDSQLFFSTKKIKDYHSYITNIYLIDSKSFLVKEVFVDDIKELINIYNSKGYAFLYDLDNMKILPNLSCGIWI